MASWQTRPVFVSSTFRDMQSERDWLRERIIPELEERLRARHAHLEAVDLRWGVDTTEVGDEEKRELLVLKVCLDEIRRCRPFLIVLLGDRYGWVPDPERMAAAVDEAGFETDVEGKSVTALEIEFGVLANTDQRLRSHFYFREPLPYEEMSPDVALQYSERHSGDPGAEASHDRLQVLKTRIETDPIWRDRVRHYSAEWDEAAQRVVGLEQLGAMVLEDVWADLEAELSPLTERAETTWQDEERAAFEEFVARCDRDFRGRVEITDELVEFALGEGGERALSLTGVSGSGKSALITRVCRKLEDADALLLAHAAGISPRSTSVEGLLLRFIGELAGFLCEEVPVEEGASAEDIEEAFASLLGRAAQRTRVVVLVDALNQFEPTPRAEYLTWLPKLWPENARLIATAIRCSASDALEERQSVRAEALPALTMPEAEDIAEAVCGRYHRTLNPDVLRVLLDKRNRAGEPAAGNPLWLELALEALNLLDQDDFGRLGTDFEGTDEERLLALLLDVAGELPAEIEDLYGWLLRESEETWGEAWAREFACLIALSRGGWRESDFEKLLPARTGEDWDPLRFAGLRRSFRAHLARRGLQSQWDFFHAQARAAVRARYLTDPAHERDVHAALADHLGVLPDVDPLHVSETMFHLIAADQKQRAALYYGSELTEGEVAGATARLAEHIIAGEGEDPNGGLWWVLSLLNAEGVEDAIGGRVRHHFIFALRDALSNGVRLRVKLVFFQATREALQRLVAAHPDNVFWQRDLSVCYGRIGDVRRAAGDLSGALEAYGTTYQMLQRLATDDPDRAQWQRDLSMSHEDIGNVRVALGDLAGAMQAYEASLQIRERLAASAPGNAGWQRDLAVSHEKIGDVRRAQGDLAGALQAYEPSHEIAERLAASDPGNVGWQRDLSISHERIGDVRVAQGDVAGGMQEFEASLQIGERLAASDPGNAEWQRDLSVSHDKIGVVRRAQGGLPGALQAYEASLEIRERLAASDPGNARWQRDLSVSHNNIGDVGVAQGDLAGALQAYEAAVDIRQRLARSDPRNSEWQHDLMASHQRIGDVAVAQAQLQTALDAYERLSEIAERLAESDPQNSEWQRGLSVSQDRIGDVRRAQGNLDGALQAYEASLQIAERLTASDAGNAQWQRDLSGSYDNVGDMRQAQGNLVGALRAYEAAVEIRQRLAESDPRNSEWQHALMASHQRIGDVAVAQAQLQTALNAYEALWEIAERLATADPGNAGWQRDLSVSRDRIGDVCVAQDDLAGAMQAYGASLQIRERLAAVDPGNAGWLIDLALSHDKIGDVRVAQDNLAGAIQAYEASLQIRERLADSDPSNAEWQRDLAVSMAMVGAVLRAQGNSSGALARYEGTLAIQERLAQFDPCNAEWQRDLYVSYWRMADMTECAGRDDAGQWWRKAYDTLAGMKQRGMHISPEDEGFLEQLRAKAGESE